MHFLKAAIIFVLENRKSNFMKTRLSKVLNFFAFNLLFFALYLNFVHKDGNALPAIQAVHTNTTVKAVLVENPEQYFEKASTKQTSRKKQSTSENENPETLELTFN